MASMESYHMFDFNIVKLLLLAHLNLNIINLSFKLYLNSSLDNVLFDTIDILL